MDKADADHVREKPVRINWQALFVKHIFLNVIIIITQNPSVIILIQK